MPNHRRQAETSTVGAFADYFHGTSPEAADAILAGGFVKELHYDDGFYWQMKDGILGAGTYVTRDPGLAAWYGQTVLRVRLQPGSRLVDMRPAADRATIASLQREFGRELLTTVAPRKVIPYSKRLTARELVELLRYRYHGAWDRPWRDRWPKRQEGHWRATLALSSMLKRYGFGGYGHPTDEEGMLIFAPDRLQPVEIVRE